MASQPQNAPIKVMVVEDDPYARERISLLLRADDIELVGVCERPEDALLLAEQQCPNVALIDLRLQGDQLGGVELIRVLRTACSGTICGVITATDAHGDYYADAFIAGAHGFILKGEGDLRDHVRQLAAGEWVVNGRIAARHVTRGAEALQWPSRTPGAREPQLSERERETLALVAQQLSTREIAEKMVISENTVKTHIAHIIDKLQVQNRDQAVLYAVLKGHLSPRRPLR